MSPFSPYSSETARSRNQSSVAFVKPRTVSVPRRHSSRTSCSVSAQSRLRIAVSMLDSETSLIGVWPPLTLSENGCCELNLAMRSFRETVFDFTVGESDSVDPQPMAAMPIKAINMNCGENSVATLVLYLAERPTSPSREGEVSICKTPQARLRCMSGLSAVARTTAYCSVWSILSSISE